MIGTSVTFAGAIETLGDMPLTVLAAGMPNPMFGDIAEEYQRYWIEQSRAVSEKSSCGRFMLVTDSSHHLHRDAPDLVLEAIATAVQEARGRKGEER